MSRRLALIVGIDQYQDTAFQPLYYAEQDARALAQWLVNEKGGKWQPADVQFVQGQHATRDLIESLITQLCLIQAGSNDLILIYFAGHAFLDERNGTGCLAFSDTHHTHSETALALTSLAQHIMTRSKAAHILFILDAFLSGPAWLMRRTSPNDMQPLLGSPMVQGLSQLENRTVLCSCRGSEHISEAGERGLGQFMYRSIIGLSGQASGAQPGTVSLQSLYTYLIAKLDEQHRPQLFGQVDDSCLLVGSSPTTTNTSFSPGTSPTFSQSSFSTATSEMQQKSFTATATVQRPYPSDAKTQMGYTASSTFASAAAEQQGQFLLEQSRQALQMQHLPEALSLVNQTLQVVPNNIQALTLKAQILGTTGQFQEALTIVEQLIQQDRTNALLWSMRAVILTNSGRHQEALTSIEHSLESDASNPESYTIKTNIMANLAVEQSQQQSPKQNPLIQSDLQQTTPRSFFTALALQIIGMLLGIVGGVLPLVRPAIPMWLPFLLEGFSLSLMCINATRGAYRHGFLHLIPPFFTSLLLAATLGISFGYKPLYRKIIFELQAHTNFLLPLLFFTGWITAAALFPFVLALAGLGVRLITGAYRKKRT
jgi:uncharacterized caspase-like protein